MTASGLDRLPPERRALVERLTRGLRLSPTPAAGAIPHTDATTYRASQAQERLWVADRLTAEPVFTVYFLQRVADEVSEAFLRSRLRWLVQHQAALRTRFRETADGLVAEIQPDGPELDVVDLSHLAGAQAEARLAELAREAAGHRFDLTADDLVRWTLVRMPAGERYMVAALHHLVCDVSSLAVAARQIADPASAPPAVSYADYALWSRGPQRQARLAGELDAWRERLAGAPPPVTLLADRPRRPGLPATVGVETVHLDPAASAALRAAARAAGTTKYMMLLAAFSEMLATWSGEPDLVLSTSVDTRVEPGLTDVVGLFTNTLLLRIPAPAGSPARAHVATVKTVVLDALSRSETPVEDVLRLVRPQWPESVVEPPVHFNYFRLAGQTAVADHLPTSCQYELCVWAVDRGAGLDVHFLYWDALFEATTARALADQFGAAVGRMCADLDAPPPSGTGYVRGAPAVAGPLLTIPEIFAAVAAACPDTLAVVGQPEHLRYRELAAAATALADRLRTDGVRRGDFVTVTTDRTPAALVAFLGVLGAGAAYVPIPPDTPPRRAEQIRADCRATAAVHHVDGGLEVRRLADSGATTTGPPLPSSPAYCIYTSGSTGQPKGVVVTHASAVAHVRGIAASLGIGPRDRVLQFHGHGFDVAIEHLMSASLTGATLVMRGDQVWPPAEFPGLLAALGVTVAPLPTAYWHEVASLPAAVWAAADLSALRVVVPGGEAMSPAALATWFARAPAHVRLVNAYGPTETLMTPTHAHLDRDAPPRARTPLGGPVAGRDLAVLDDRLAPVPPGAIGELYIGGGLLAQGYHGASGRTAAAFVPDPFSATPGARMYRTGDLVRWTATGDLEFVGRRDAQVKLRGVRIEPAEIEAALRTHPAVAQAAVALVEADDPYLAAWVVGPGGRPVPAGGELRAFLRERLPADLVPRVVVERPALPTTDGGKIDRRALVAELASRPRTAPAAAGPSVAGTVARAFASVLDLPQVADDDNFFSLGGHSLLAARVATRLTEELGREVGLIDLLERPTPAALAEVILNRGASTRAGGRIPRRDVAVGDVLPLAPIQQGLWFSSQITPAAAYTVPLALGLDGPLDAGRLEAALRRLVELHTALRCAIVDVNGRPQGRLLPADLSLPARPVADETQLFAELSRMAVEPIDLAAGPVRAALFRLDEESHLLYLGVHHTACDGASVEHLLAQLLAEYERPGSAAPPAIGFADYAAWLAEHTAGQTAALAFWAGYLDGRPDLALPTDRARPPLVDFTGDHILLHIDAALTAALGGLARARGTTTFTLVLAGWAALIGRWAGQDDIDIGVPMSRRDHADLADVVGPVLTTLPVRLRLDGDPTFAELAERTRTELATCYAAACVSFEQIVEAVVARRDPARTPLFQTMVSWEGRRDPATVGGTALTPYPIGNAAAKTDLVLLLEETGAGLDAVIEFATALFDRVTVERLGEVFLALLAAASADPGTRLSTLPAPPRPAPPDPSAPTMDTPAATVDTGTDPVPPRDDTERVLERILAGALSVDGLGVHDDFFVFGGNSLSAIEVTTYVRRVFQVDLPVTALFETPTVAGLAETLRALAPSAEQLDRVSALAVEMLLTGGDAT